MNQETYNDHIFSVLSSYRAKPLHKILTLILRRVEEPHHNKIRETLQSQLDSLVNESLLDKNSNGYKINPFHPFHSQVMPDIDEKNLPPDAVGPSTSNFRNETWIEPPNEPSYIPDSGFGSFEESFIEGMAHHSSIERQEGFGQISRDTVIKEIRIPHTRVELIQSGSVNPLSQNLCLLYLDHYTLGLIIFFIFLSFFTNPNSWWPFLSD